MVVKSDQVLHDFYVQYLAWHAAGAGAGTPFFRNGGLCSNFNDFLLCYQNKVLSLEFRTKLRRQLTQQFIDAGLDGKYPFNPGGEDEYDQEHDRGQMHLNPARIAWVVTAVQKGFASAAG